MVRDSVDGDAKPSGAQPSGRSDAGGVHSSFLGNAHDVVQARDVHGGVHFYASAAGPKYQVPRQLPAGVHGFVDRAAERRTLEHLLADSVAAARIVVVTGTAGVGKTSLALHWAQAARELFPDGQLYADLHGYDPQIPVSAEQVLERFLQALSTVPASTPADGELMAAAFRSRVAGRRLLVVLDNAATAALPRPLLPGAAGSLVIVTSRHRLGGLGVREGARHLTLNVLDEEAAVELLQLVTADQRVADIRKTWYGWPRCVRVSRWPCGLPPSEPQDVR